MDTLTFHLTQRSEELSEEEEGEGVVLREELRFEALEEGEGPVCDIRGLQLRYHHGNRRGCLLLSVGGVILFTAAFLLTFILTGGFHCSQEGGLGEGEQGGGANTSPEGGAGLYLGELREMMRMFLKDEDIHKTVSPAPSQFCSLP
ncbi:hypothetical protein FQA47_002262 [Oryzias melastigma]|uniref:Uncharacterized protein n=1 Tax=Oryzias melastigma TaxID=30732 RepID=A0A834FKG2_ORYME|nr:hypothetical protein FQA47_002262 [Oryzias melastigma]